MTAREGVERPDGTIVPRDAEWSTSTWDAEEAQVIALWDAESTPPRWREIITAEGSCCLSAIGPACEHRQTSKPLSHAPGDVMSYARPRTADTGPGSLSYAMDFDHVIQVSDGGTLAGTFPTVASINVYAPELYVYPDDDDAALIASADQQGWELLSGYTGQYSYSGPVMHPSELIAGRIAQEILSRPGLYVAVAVECLDANGEQEDAPAGWAIAYREVTA